VDRPLPAVFFERKPGASRCGNGYKDYLALWEIRSALPTRIARTLFFVHEGEIVLLHGFIKKTRKTPSEDRALALQRKNAYIKTS
jgi:phage-related protein